MTILQDPYVTAPEYIVGTNNVVVFINGTLTWDFEEVATVGSITSTTVKLLLENFDPPLEVNDKIVVLRRPGVLLSPTKINATHYDVEQYNAIVQAMLKSAQPTYVTKEACNKEGYFWFQDACWELRDDTYVKLLTLNSAKTRLGPGKLLSNDDTLIHNVPIWDPARGHHAPIACHDIDYQLSEDIARYSYAPDGNIDPDENYWADNEVGTIWLDSHDLAYVPYYDDKIFDSVDDRISKWAKLADWASVDVYQWTKSTVHPSKWEDLVAKQAGDMSIDSNDKATGTPMKRLFKRTRNSQTFNIQAASLAYTEVLLDTTLTGPLAATDETQLTTATYTANVDIDGIVYDLVIPGQAAQNYQGLVDKINEDLDLSPVTVELQETGFKFVTEDTSIQTIIVTDVDLFASLTVTEELEYSYSVISLTTISIAGQDVTSRFAPGYEFTIGNSTFNDGTYTVNTSTFTGGDTIITLVSGLVDTTSDGVIVSTAFVPVWNPQLINVNNRVDSQVSLNAGSCIAHELIPSDGIEVYVVGDNVPPEFESGSIYTIVADSPWLLHDATGTAVRSSVNASITLVEKEFPAEFIESRNSYASFVAGIDGADANINNTIFDLSVDFNESFDVCDIVDVYLDGQFVATAELTTDKRIDTGPLFISAGLEYLVETFQFSSIALGKTITIVRKKDEPSAEELAFDPGIEDDGVFLTQYKEDYDYVVREVLDKNRNLKQVFYFWVSNKTTRSPRKMLSVLEIKNQIGSLAGPYMFYQNLLPATRRNVRLASSIPIAATGGPYGTTGTVPVNFDGSGSIFPDGVINHVYNWDFGDGTVGTGQYPTHSYLAVGTYNVTLVVQGLDTNKDVPVVVESKPTTTTVEVSYPTPIADPNGPYTGLVNVPVIFDGTGSQNFAPGSLSYFWNFGDGNVGTGIAPTHTYTTDGNFIVTLTVNDGFTDSIPVQVSTLIEFGDPIADSGGPYTIAINQPLTFAGSGIDPAGLPLHFNWTYGDGNNGTDVGPTPVHAYTSTGVFSVTLIADNGTSTSAPDTTTVTVTDPPPPTAVIGGAAQLEAAIGRVFAFDGSGSFDPTGYSLTYAWDFQSVQFPGVNTSTLENPTFTYTSSGIFTVSLVVNNGYADSTTVTKPCRVSEAPIADPGASLTVQQFAPLTLDGSGSTNPSGLGTLSYNWDFGDGFNGSGISPSHIWNTAGVYNVTLVVNNGIHDSDPVSVPVTVFAAPPPIADPNGPYTAQAGLGMSFDGSWSTNPSGVGTLTYTWDFDYDGATFNPTGVGVTPVHTYTSVGTYNVALVVDNGYDSALSTTYVVVSPPTYEELPVAWPGTPTNISLSDNGSRVLVGVDDHTLGVNSGAIVYAENVSGWVEHQVIHEPIPASSNFFGQSIAISSLGDTMVTGSKSGVYLYTLSGTIWSLQQAIADPTSGAIGVAISSDGNTVAFSKPLDGTVSFYVRSGGIWSHQQTVSGASHFGEDIDLSADGNVCVIGSPQTGISLSGEVHVYSRSGSTWSQTQVITYPTPILSEMMGQSVSISSSGDTILTGAPYAPNLGNQGGEALVFERSGGTWGYQTTLTAQSASVFDARFGQKCSLSGDGNIAMVTSASPESVWMFQRIGNKWTSAVQRQATVAQSPGIDIAKDSVWDIPPFIVGVADPEALGGGAVYIHTLDWSAGPNTIEVNPIAPSTDLVVPATTAATPSAITIPPEEDVAHFLPDRYTQVIVRGLGNQIQEDEKMKLRFIQDFTLRDNYLDSDNSLKYKIQHGNTETMDLKNKHSEWELFREKQSGNIPKVLWNKMVEAVVGFDLDSGLTIPVPSPERILYDTTHGTATRFGLESGQAFVDQTTAKSTIMGLLQDPSFDTYPIDKEVLLATYNMDTAENTKAMMDFIYDHFSSRQVNKIFFEVFYDALTNKHEYPGIIKTSLIALQNIRLLETEDNS